jgi:hypothetical protein
LGTAGKQLYKYRQRRIGTANPGAQLEISSSGTIKTYISRASAGKFRWRSFWKSVISDITGQRKTGW